ncbi:hypothetical protein BJG93_35050 [Paraburkholderia sprentiae WSM5005]|uniref:Uncharacterized protein n=1 Tax=Paraburkholderia sprentiae WSM5005 TaxID=754502 RepID=A0A8F4QJL9_9BURK|nr:hypothetical protein [Paraburkholderia sprentiae]QXE07171.1 hypothetical protein BJG93_35050 [Paraburkholderia sprentiae WSM5005]
MSLSVFEMHSVEMFCQRPPGACYVICDEWHYKACLRKAADLEQAQAETGEFLGIAGLNCRDWGKDRKLVERIIKHGWLWFHNVRDRNPEIDGWWVISALLDEVRRGTLLAIKGRRADFFPSSHTAPIGTFTARAVQFTNDGPMLSGQYDPGTRQTRLIAARAATSGGDSDGAGVLDAPVAAVRARAADREVSTLLGNAQPFEYTRDAVSGDSFDIAKTPNTGEPGTWYTNPGSGQMRMFGDDGQRVVDFDFDHDHGQGVPHAHNWAINPLSGKLGRGPGLPFSLLP